MSFCIANCPQLLPKRVLHTEQFSSSTLNFQDYFFSLRISSMPLRLLPRLSSLLFFLQQRVLEGSSYARCDQTSLTSLYLFYVGYSSSPRLSVILLHFSHDRSKSSSPLFSSTTFQNFPFISDLLYELSNFQHHKNLCSK